MRRPFQVLVPILAALALSAGTVAASAAPATASTCAALNPFTGDWLASFDATWGGEHMAAAVTDEATGCTFRFGSSESFPTASTAKAEIMGALFLSLQDQGATALDGGTAALVSAMIQVSDNDAAETLFEQLGGAGALQLYGERLGLRTTDNASWNWGGTATTPEDQLALLHNLLVGGGALNDTWVATARRYMGDVVPEQAWGVSAGVPAGSTVWLKNGWLYNDGSYWGRTGWRINSIGVVQLPNGRRYSLAVFGNGYDLMSDGTAVAEQVSRQVASVLSAARNHPAAAPVSTLAAVDAGSVFAATTPTRLLDTRTAGGALPAGGEVVVTVPAVDGVVPTAVALNVTAVDAASPGYVTAYADGTARPLASTLDQQPGRVVPNLAVVPVGADGKVRLYTSQPTQLVVDLLGSWVAHPGAATAGRYRALTPSRLLDTRSTSGAVPAGGTVTVAVAGHGGVPATGVAAVAVNVTVTDSAAAGYWTVWPSGTARPLASTLNSAAGVTVANTTIVPLGADGTVSIYGQSGGQVVVDVVGWVTDATAVPGTDGRFVALAAPTRVADTRFGDGDTDRVTAGATLTVATAAAGVPTTAAAVAATVTYTDPRADGFVTTFPAGSSRPLASTTNPSTTIGTWANSTVAGVAGGRLQAYSLGSTELVVDVTGWFTA